MHRLVCVLLVAACKREAPAIEDAAPPPVVSTVASEAPVVDAGVPKPSMTLETKRLLERWDSAWNAHDANSIALNYAPQVRWYGHSLTRDACKDKVVASIAKSPAQTQSSVADVVTELPDGVRVKVTKTVTNGEKSKPQTLFMHLVKSQSGGLRIDEEGESEDALLEKQR